MRIPNSSKDVMIYLNPQGRLIHEGDGVIQYCDVYPVVDSGMQVGCTFVSSAAMDKLVSM